MYIKIYINISKHTKTIYLGAVKKPVRPVAITYCNSVMPLIEYTRTLIFISTITFLLFKY